MQEAVCMRCGSFKDAALGRCGSCQHLPVGEEQEVAMLCSNRMLALEELSEVAGRIKRGEFLKPSKEARQKARLLISPGPEEQRLSQKQLVQLLVANLLLTPLIGYAVWFRARGAPAGIQALAVTIPASIGLGALIIVLRFVL